LRAGTNIQTNEEVAIKLVRALFLGMDCLDLCPSAGFVVLRSDALLSTGAGLACSLVPVVDLIGAVVGQIVDLIYAALLRAIHTFELALRCTALSISRCSSNQFG
jgi:hypothetical protein